jgi:glycerophosphoryl diester phosphodiesterase
MGCQRGWWRGLTMRPPRSCAGRRAPGSGRCIEHFLLHAGLVNRLRSEGLSVTTGTINDATLATRAAALGVDTITTDRPAALHREAATALAA